MSAQIQGEMRTEYTDVHAHMYGVIVRNPALLAGSQTY